MGRKKKEEQWIDVSGPELYEDEGEWHQEVLTTKGAYYRIEHTIFDAPENGNVVDSWAEHPLRADAMVDTVKDMGRRNWKKAIRRHEKDSKVMNVRRA